MKLLAYFLSLIMAFTVIAGGDESPPNFTHSMNKEQLFELMNDNQLVRSELKLIERRYVILENRFEKLLEQHQELLAANKAHEVLINNTRSDQNNSDVSSHSVWTSLMLGAATLVITGLSISIAILAVWGYRNIKQGAIDESVKLTEKKVTDSINEQKFDETIHHAVEKVVYRHILSEEDFPESEEEMEND